MIEETIHIHDQYQCEIKLGYELDDLQKSTTYDIETYLFLPSNLGINRQTYSPAEFYADIQAYIRLKTPTVLLQDMIRGKKNPFTKLQESLDQLVADITPITIAEYEYQIKMFGCIFKSAIRDQVAFIVERAADVDLEDLLAQYLSSIEEITRSFRSLRGIINVPTITRDLFSIYAFGDEYLSVLIESYTYTLITSLEICNFPGKTNYISRLLALITAELAYRQRQHYPSIPETASTNESFVFRTGVLKKYIGSVLFLTTQVRPEGEFVKQFVFALAAGIAMIFATATSFLAQSTYTNLSLPLFIAMVISYMFKDRIKELMRWYWGNKLRHLLFDHKRNIYARPKEKIGWCKESFAFTTSRKIPHPILKLRNRDHLTEIEDNWVDEQIIVYRKRIRLFREKLDHLYRDYSVESINDIMRLNVLRFLEKMDDPKKPLYVTDGQTYRKIYGDRVYHITMIMKYSTDTMTLYKRFRIVLSRDGIKRIEEVDVDADYAR